MQIQSFKIYAENTIKLVRSMVIKSSSTAEEINTRLKAMGHVIDSDPKTWKYYLNLSGEYHPLDKKIKVISSDTKEEITFNRSTIVDHPLTLLDYSPGGRFHDDLIKNHPKLSILIKGVSSPIKIEDAIAADDFAILHYDKELVGEQEELLLLEIKQWIKGFVDRWFNQDFQVSDNLFVASFIGIMVQHMVPAIINIRAAYARTPYAADFHIWSDLSGHYDIDAFKDFLNREQKMFLYRNLPYIRKNAGKPEVLKTLIDKLITPKDLLVDKYDFIQQDNSILSTGRPSPKFAISEFNNSDAKEEIITPELMLNETRNVALDNRVDLETDILRLKTKGRLSLENRAPTGILKVNERFGSEIVSESIEQLKLDYWIYLTHLNKIDFDVEFTIPGKTTSVVLTSKNALILLFFAMNMSTGNEPEFIPEVQVKNVFPAVYPETSQIMPLVDREVVTEADIEKAREFLIPLPNIENLGELETFVEKARVIRQRHQSLWATKTTAAARGMYKNACGAFYSFVNCTFAPDKTSYNEWLDSIDFNKYGYSDSDWFALGLKILEVAIGVSAASTNLPPDKSAMVSIIDRLTSYNINILEGFSSSKYKSLPWIKVNPECVEVSEDSSGFYGFDMGILDRPDMKPIEETLGIVHKDLSRIKSIDPEIVSNKFDVGLKIKSEIIPVEDKYVSVSSPKVSDVNITILE